MCSKTAHSSVNIIIVASSRCQFPHRSCKPPMQPFPVGPLRSCSLRCFGCSVHIELDRRPPAQLHTARTNQLAASAHGTPSSAWEQYDYNDRPQLYTRGSLKSDEITRSIPNRSFTHACRGPTSGNSSALYFHPHSLAMPSVVHRSATCPWHLSSSRYV